MPFVTYLPGTAPLVLDSPHSGTDYPDDFGTVCDRGTLRRAEDTHVEKLYSFAPELGVAWIEAHFPRSYLDANRDTTEVDVADARRALARSGGHRPGGVVESAPGQRPHLALHRRRRGPVRAQAGCGRGPGADRRTAGSPTMPPSEQAIDAAHARHGYSLHVNCHSMPAVAASHATDFPGLVHADFVIGNRDGHDLQPGSDRVDGRLAA
jgi:N-formylglutamate deformylase